MSNFFCIDSRMRLFGQVAVVIVNACLFTQERTWFYMTGERTRAHAYTRRSMSFGLKIHHLNNTTHAQIRNIECYYKYVHVCAAQSGIGDSFFHLWVQLRFDDDVGEQCPAILIRRRSERVSFSTLYQRLGMRQITWITDEQFYDEMNRNRSSGENHNLFHFNSIEHGENACDFWLKCHFQWATCCEQIKCCSIHILMPVTMRIISWCDVISTRRYDVWCDKSAGRKTSLRYHCKNIMKFSKSMHDNILLYNLRYGEVACCQAHCGLAAYSKFTIFLNCGVGCCGSGLTHISWKTFPHNMLVDISEVRFCKNFH